MFSVSLYGLVKKAKQSLSSKILGGAFTLRLAPRGSGESRGRPPPLGQTRAEQGVECRGRCSHTQGPGGPSGPANLLTTTYFEKRGHRK